MKIRGWHISAIGSIIAFAIALMGFLMYLKAPSLTGFGALIGALVGIIMGITFLVIGGISLVPTLFLRSKSKGMRKIGAITGIFIFLISLFYQPALLVTVFVLFGSVIALLREM